jgi:DNA-binding XRE family transcriptional regulator
MDKKKSTSKLVYEGEIFQIEFYALENGDVPAEDFMESLTQDTQQKFAALFMRLADVGKIWNERKFKHLTNSDQTKHQRKKSRWPKSIGLTLNNERGINMSKKSKNGWINRKLSDPKFKEGLEKQYEKLSIGEQLTKLRLNAKLTQKQLAKKIGTTASAISRYENAEYDRYEIQTLRKIVDACGASIRIIFEEKRKKAKVA